MDETVFRLYFVNVHFKWSLKTIYIMHAVTRALPLRKYGFDTNKLHTSIKWTIKKNKQKYDVLK